ncbi:MAG: heme lyase CcmF/NrfE family subunit [Alphaproteobacteria bacterium]
MITEIGHFSLIFAFVLSLCQSLAPIYAARKSIDVIHKVTIRLAILNAIFVLISFSCLVWAFIVSDFSVALVAEHSHSSKPMIYKISGSWGNHEGSLLMWIVILSIFGAGLALTQKTMELIQKSATLGVQGVISSAFIAFSLFTSNPFERLSLPALNGNGLNPVLQDIGLALHPPTLYVGYVGLSLAFSFAVAGLITNSVDRNWARYMRVWVQIAWCALTLGIGLGSWWAYYELGWGGWWFWDPVENASLMPWLVATALLHSVIVVEQRDLLKSWTVLLAITGFSLSLLGTFIVRSGLLTSVHSFASDPTRGLFILGILIFSIGPPLLLFAIQGPKIKSNGYLHLLSRETGLVMNNFLLICASIIILIGTFYPIALEIATGMKITVGPPYFEATFNPIMALLVIMMGIGPFLVWKRGILPKSNRIWIVAIAGTSLISAISFWASPKLSISALAGIATAGWLGITILCDIFVKIQKLNRNTDFWPHVLHLQWGMWIAHFGIVIFLVGALGDGIYKTESVARMHIGDKISLGFDSAELQAISNRNGRNYEALVATLKLSDSDNKQIGMLYPEKRIYPVERQTTTEAAIRQTVTADYYAVLGDGNKEDGYTVRLYHKPFVSWIWIGVIMMALGVATSILIQRSKPKETDTALTS